MATENKSTIAKFGSFAKALTAWLKDFVLLAVGISILVLLPKVSIFMTTTTRTVDNIGTSAANIGAATVAIENKAADQDARVMDIEAKFEKLADQSSAAIQAATDVLNTANQTLKQGQASLPEVTQAIKNANVALVTLNDQEKKIGGAVDAAHETITILNTKTLPQVNVELAEVRSATMQADNMLTNANGAVGHVNHVAAYYDNQLTKPKKLAVRVGNFFLHLGEQAVADFAAFKLSGF